VLQQTPITVLQKTAITVLQQTAISVLQQTAILCAALSKAKLRIVLYFPLYCFCVGMPEDGPYTGRNM
jgi:hypothetical protein